MIVGKDSWCKGEIFWVFEKYKSAKFPAYKIFKEVMDFMHGKEAMSLVFNHSN